MAPPSLMIIMLFVVSVDYCGFATFQVSFFTGDCNESRIYQTKMENPLPEKFEVYFPSISLRGWVL